MNFGNYIFKINVEDFEKPLIFIAAKKIYANYETKIPFLRVETKLEKPTFIAVAIRKVLRSSVSKQVIYVKGMIYTCPFIYSSVLMLYNAVE